MVRLEATKARDASVETWSPEGTNEEM